MTNPCSFHGVTNEPRRLLLDADSAKWAFLVFSQILTRDCVTISVDAVIYWRTSHSDRVICVVDNIK